MTRLPDQPIAEKYRIIAAGFSDRVRAVSDWDAPTPVQEWAARDVVNHLVTWLPAVLGDVAPIQPGPSAADDPVGAWAAFDTQVQQILDDPASMDLIHTHQYTGQNPVPELINNIFTGDVFFHTWDLARSNGLDDTLDADLVHDAYVGMSAAEEQLRPSGQFGQQQPVADDATDQDKLFAFLGRDPHWAPPHH
ncbi:maleylpyruvate isomerase N-terminal domain-containing protein [Calidifontibacter terrae]